MCLQRIKFFCSAVFCKGLRRGKSFGSGCLLLLGSAMGPRCACRGEAGVGRGGRGSDCPGRRVFSCLHRIMSFCCGVLIMGLRRGKGVGSNCWLLLGSAMGPRCACRGETVVVWYCDVDIGEDANLTEGDMHLERTPISTPPECPGIAETRKRTRGIPFCLIGGAGGGKGGWEGTSNSLILI